MPGNGFKDLTGQRFGHLVVIEQDFNYVYEHNIKNKNAVYWKCQCDCGNIKSIFRSNLTSGATNSCGCLNKQSIKDLTGKVFGKLTVLSPSDKRVGGGMVWRCQCSCGRIIEASSHNLLQGGTQSCGCKKGKDLTGQRFGKLTAQYTLEQRHTSGALIWHCKCDCGNECNVRSIELLEGATQSCGCLISKGEFFVQNILIQNNIEFEKQKTFEDLKSDKNYPYRYDFYLPKYNRLIEFDCEQHYKYNKTGWNTKERYESTFEHDSAKNEYALSHNIPLVRIPYWERDNITLEMIMGDQYLIKNE